MLAFAKAPRRARTRIWGRMATIALIVAGLLAMQARVYRRLSAPNYVPSCQSPASYSVLFGGEKHMDALPLLASLAIFHANAHIYISSDTTTYEWYMEHAKVLSRRLNMHWTLSLDKYNLSMGRVNMEETGAWKGFMLEKADIMELALAHHNDTMFVDADVILLAPMYIPACRFQLGVSPHFIAPTEAAKYGVYNAGMIWSNQYSIGKAWRETTKVSRYFEQAAIEDLVKKYAYFEFGPEHNVAYYRAAHAADALAASAFLRGITLNHTTQRLTFQGKTLASVHAHILTKYPWEFANEFSDTIVHYMSQSSDPAYRKILDVIDWAKGGYGPSQLPL